MYKHRIAVMRPNAYAFFYSIASLFFVDCRIIICWYSRNILCCAVGLQQSRSDCVHLLLLLCCCLHVADDRKICHTNSDGLNAHMLFSFTFVWSMCLDIAGTIVARTSSSWRMACANGKRFWGAMSLKQRNVLRFGSPAQLGSVVLIRVKECPREREWTPEWDRTNRPTDIHSIHIEHIVFRTLRATNPTCVHVILHVANGAMFYGEEEELIKGGQIRTSYSKVGEIQFFVQLLSGWAVGHIVNRTFDNI